MLCYRYDNEQTKNELSKFLFTGWPLMRSASLNWITSQWMNIRVPWSSQAVSLAICSTCKSIHIRSILACFFSPGFSTACLLACSSVVESIETILGCYKNLSLQFLSWNVKDRYWGTDRFGLTWRYRSLHALYMLTAIVFFFSCDYGEDEGGTYSGNNEAADL